MLYQKPSLWTRLSRLRGFRHLTAFVAGIHTANGLAHGVAPPTTSMTRRRKQA